MTDKPKIIRVSDLAKLLKVTTATILEFLDGCNYELPRQHMQPVSEEMFLDLLKRFDKVKFGAYVCEVQSESIQDLALNSIHPRDGLPVITTVKTGHGLPPTGFEFALDSPRKPPREAAVDKPGRSSQSAEEAVKSGRARAPRKAANVRVYFSKAGSGAGMAVGGQAAGAIILNNIDLELINLVINMTNLQKLDLIAGMLD